ncbi:hypothetical protein [Nocardiopsis sp. RV163]|nr:hypothetical protein [Nocardiopsis sp. RV163]
MSASLAMAAWVIEGVPPSAATASASVPRSRSSSASSSSPSSG